MAFKNFHFDFTTTFLLYIYSKCAKSKEITLDMCHFRILVFRFCIGLVVNTLILAIIISVLRNALKFEIENDAFFWVLFTLIFVFSTLFHLLAYVVIYGTKKSSQGNSIKNQLQFYRVYKCGEVILDALLCTYSVYLCEFKITPAAIGIIVVLNLDILTCIITLIIGCLINDNKQQEQQSSTWKAINRTYKVYPEDYMDDKAIRQNLKIVSTKKQMKMKAKEHDTYELKEQLQIKDRKEVIIRATDRFELATKTSGKRPSLDEKIRTHDRKRRPNTVITSSLAPKKSPPSSNELTFYSSRNSGMNKHHLKVTDHHNILQNLSPFVKAEFIKNCFMECVMDKRLLTMYDRTMKTENGLKNLFIKCDDYIVSCDVDKRLHAKINKSYIPIGSEFCWKNIVDFGKLYLTIHYMDRQKLSSKFWANVFLPVVENKDSNLCLFFLTIMNDIEPLWWEQYYHYLLKGLSYSMINQDKDTSKVIAWFITKKFYRSLDESIRESMIDIWPAFRCSCNRRKQDICSGKIEIIIEMSTLFSDLPATFWKVDISFVTDEKVKNKEGSQLHKHLQNSSGNIHIRNKKALSSEDAKQLFDEHKNLTLVCKSPFKSTGFRRRKQRVIEQSCFQLYCKRKGLIPIGENHFPRALNGLQTDVLEGSPHLLSRLKIGNQVGTDDFKKGTLGGFVQVRGEKAFLTCLHVFLSTDELASDNLSLDDEQTVPVKLYRKNKQSRICGKIRDIAFEVDNEKETSIDAALVEIPADSIDNSNYVDVENGQLSFKDIGMKSQYLNSSCVDYRPLLFSIPKPVLRTVSVGAVSGCFDGDKAQVEANEEKYIDLEPIDQLYSRAVLEEIKRNVNIVINHLQLIPIAVLPEEKIIKKSIKHNCDPNLSSEIKNIIIDVIQNIYLKIQCGSEVDIDNFILCKTKSRFSAIIADVHMQHAFLKKTGKNMSMKRTTRRVYNQLYISNIPFQAGDSGTCIYVLSPVQGCIGMAIADHPQGGCIATPIMDILKHFKIRIK